MIDLGQFNILGVKISAVDYEAAVDHVCQSAQSGLPLAVSALAVHGVMTGVLDRRHRHRLNQFDLLVPDGQPVRWALRWLHGVNLADRVYGPTLMLNVCQRAAQQQLPIFLYGSTEEILSGLQQRLMQRFPTLQIAGCRASRFRRLTPDERDQTVQEIRDSGARMTFVGLGCPRQEVWAYEFRELLRMPVLAVGAAFAFHAGCLAQAPPQWQRRGLEWAYRLLREPRRLWKRYLLLNPLYLTLIVAQRTGLHRFDPRNTEPPTGELLYG